MTTLPPDILFFQILPRLPEKSVHRFLCVSKQWQSFLTTPIFAKMHHHHHKQLLIVLSATTPCKFQTIDCEAPEDGPSTVSRPLPFDHENVSIVASVRGLVCVRIINEKEYSDLILWNPLSDEYKTLSVPNNKECYITTARVFGLYYSCNDYKILLVTRYRDVYIYSLKSDSWRKVETTQEDLKFLIPSRYWVWRCWEQPYVLLNGKLYFLIRRINMKLRYLISYSIIRFDLKTEKLRKIATPFETDPDQSMTRCLSFTVIRECIHLSVKCFTLNAHHTTDNAIEVWRMDGDGDWTKMATYINRPSFPWFYGLESILHFMKNGNWLMHYQSGIYKLNFEKHTKEKMCSSNGIIIHTGGKYIETMGINLFNRH